MKDKCFKAFEFYNNLILGNLKSVRESLENRENIKE